MADLHLHAATHAPPAISAPRHAESLKPLSEPKPAPAPSTSHGPAVILGGALARPAEPKPSPKPVDFRPPVKAPPAPSASSGQYINRVI